MRQIEVQIMGAAYLLGVPEHGEARLHSAVKKVDDAMCRIRDAGKIKARDRIAVLAALNLAFELADRDLAPGTLKNPRLVQAQPPAPGTPAQLARLSALTQRLDAALDKLEDGVDAEPDPASGDPAQAPGLMGLQ